MNDQPAKNSRKGLRFKPEASTTTFVEANTTGLDDDFRKELSALMVSESHSGCALVVPATELLQVEETCRILSEPGGVRTGTVVWRKELDEDAVKVGIQFVL